MEITVDMPGVRLCRVLAFHIFQNLRPFDKKLWQAWISHDAQIETLSGSLASTEASTLEEFRASLARQLVNA